MLRISNPVDFAECQSELLLKAWRIIEDMEGVTLCLPLTTSLEETDPNTRHAQLYEDAALDEK